MSKRLFKFAVVQVLILSSSIFSHAKSLQCLTEQSCDQIIRQAEHVKLLFKERTTKLGVKYIRDQSIPGLGEAYRDPQGLIWGAPIVDADGEPVKMTLKDAKTLCSSIQARLPSAAEYKRLIASLLNRNEFRWSFYSDTHIEGSKLEFLPGLTWKEYFWTSSPFEPGYKPDIVLAIFSGSHLNIFGDYINDNKEFAVRCVADSTVE